MQHSSCAHTAGQCQPSLLTNFHTIFQDGSQPHEAQLHLAALPAGDFLAAVLAHHLQVVRADAGQSARSCLCISLRLHHGLRCQALPLEDHLVVNLQGCLLASVSSRSNAWGAHPLQGSSHMKNIHYQMLGQPMTEHLIEMMSWLVHRGRTKQQTRSIWGSAKDDAENAKEDAKSTGRSFWGSAKDEADDTRRDARDAYGNAKSQVPQPVGWRQG